MNLILTLILGIIGIFITKRIIKEFKKKTFKIKNFYFDAKKGYLKMNKEQIFLKNDSVFEEDNEVVHLCDQNIYVYSKFLKNKGILVEDTDGNFFGFEANHKRETDNGVVYEDVEFYEIDAQSIKIITDEDLIARQVELTIQLEKYPKGYYKHITQMCEKIIKEYNFFKLNVTSQIDGDSLKYVFLKYVFVGEEENIYEIIGRIQEKIDAEDVYKSLILREYSYNPIYIFFKPRYEYFDVDVNELMIQQMKIDNKINNI